MKRRWISLLVIMCMGMSLLTCPSWATGSSKVSYQTAMSTTENYMADNLSEPGFGNEWSIIALARNGGAVKYGTYIKYYNNLVKTVKTEKGRLARKNTPYSRVVLALTAMGKNPADVGGYNLLENFSDFDEVKKEGISGPVWALIALDSGDYEIPQAAEGKTQTTRDLLIAEIVKREVSGGGFTAMSSGAAESDITAMAVQALSNYTDREDVKAVVDRAIHVLSEKQSTDGSFEDYDTKSAESIAQVIIALTMLDINPVEDPRFVKNGNTLLTALMEFYDEDGGFRHVNVTTGGYKAVVNRIATEQSYLALCAYDRYVNGRNTVFDMGDGMDISRPVKVTLGQFESAKKGSLMVQWKKVSGVKGYEISYAGKTKRVTGAGTLKTTLTGLSSTKYTYVKVRGYKLDANGDRVYGAYSTAKKVKANGMLVIKPAKVTNVTVKSTKTKKMTVKWKKVTNAKGYQIRYATNSKFKSSKVVYVSSKYASKTISKLKKGKTYYVKVRAYKKKVNGTKVYGSYSTVKKVKVK